nr:immunoglobulin heavy chain junction region [Mus musculus]MBK4198553.1 immunoglobulin heavy chain junction region [Mus musculus]MBK4198554.1 immunoglobulin heavy chain junction region [Mus musculus]
CARGHYDYW